MSNDFIVCARCRGIDIVALTGPPVHGLYYCSEHHPAINQWHGQFPKETYNPDQHLVINAPGTTIHLG